MIFAWIFLASTAIIMPRHYKYLFRPQKVCGAHMWFVLHFPVMVFAAALNLIALLLILAEKDWKWIRPANTVEFVHSIFGIVSIGLLYLQMFLGAARPACCALLGLPHARWSACSMRVARPPPCALLGLLRAR